VSHFEHNWMDLDYIYLLVKDGTINLQTIKRQNFKLVSKYARIVCDEERALTRREMCKFKTTTLLLFFNDIDYYETSYFNLVCQYGLAFRNQGGQMMLQKFRISLCNEDVKQLHNRQCQYCKVWKFEGGMTKCGRCMCTYYCSRECQRAMWSVHKKSCDEIVGSNKMFLHKKINLAWSACLIKVKSEILEFFEEVKEKTGKCVKILMPMAYEVYRGIWYIVMLPISIKFLKEVCKWDKESLIMLTNHLKRRNTFVLLTSCANVYTECLIVL
jgi:hypothetical protein